MGTFNVPKMAKYIIVGTVNDVQLTSHSPTIMPVQYGPQLDFGYFIPVWVQIKIILHKLWENLFYKRTSILNLRPS